MGGAKNKRKGVLPFSQIVHICRFMLDTRMNEWYKGYMEDNKIKKLGKKEIFRIEETRVGGFGLRLTEKVFLNALLVNDGKLAASYRAAFPEEAAKVCIATQLSRAKAIVGRASVQGYMEQILESKEISPEFILGGISKIAKNGLQEKDQLHAYELLGKFLKMFKSEAKGSTTLNLNINESTATRLLERRQKHEIGGRGDFIDVNPGGGSGNDVDGEEKFD